MEVKKKKNYDAEGAAVKRELLFERNYYRFHKDVEI